MELRQPVIQIMLTVVGEVWEVMKADAGVHTRNGIRSHARISWLRWCKRYAIALTSDLLLFLVVGLVLGIKTKLVVNV
jgi:hypothetical protein